MIPTATGADLRAGGPSGSLNGERFAGSHVTVKNDFCGKSWNATFSGSGSATGLYAGTFTAHGSWAFADKGTVGIWAFRETFIISSGISSVRVMLESRGLGEWNGKQFPARCNRFLSSRKLSYKARGGKGNASTAGIKNGMLRESFYE